MKIRLMAGEMASMRNISKQTLIYYDRIGLFQPNETDPDTGYRYYSLEQFEELDVILCLKSIGLSLKEIKAYLKLNSNDSRFQALKTQQAVLDDRLEKLQKDRERLNNIISYHQTSLSITPFQMTISRWDRVALITREVPPPGDHYALESSFVHFLQHAQDQYNADVQDIIVFIDNNYPETERFIKVGLLREAEGAEYLPQGDYAHIYHKGTFDEAAQTTRLLLDEIKKQGYTPHGPFLSRLLVSALVAVDESEYILDVAIQVKKDRT